jgi:hypothetical protein
MESGILVWVPLFFIWFSQSISPLRSFVVRYFARTQGVAPGLDISPLPGLWCVVAGTEGVSPGLGISPLRGFTML